MFERIEPTVDRRPRTSLLMLVLHKVVHLAKRHLREGDGHRRKKHMQIQGITREGMRRELPALKYARNRSMVAWRISSMGYLPWSS